MKIQNIMNMLLGGLMVLGSLTACGGSDGDSVPATTPAPYQPESQTKDQISLKVEYAATVSQQLLDVANVTVRYIGENGQVVSEQMSSTTWTKTVNIALPAKAGMDILPTLKGAVSNGEYTLAAKGRMTYTWLDQNGQQIQAGHTEETPDMEAVFNAAGLGQYLGAIAANCQLARAFTKDYTVTETEGNWGGNAAEDNTQSTGISNEGATDDNR